MLQPTGSPRGQHFFDQRIAVRSVPHLLDPLDASSDRIPTHVLMGTVGPCNRIYNASFRCNRCRVTQAIIEELRSQGAVGLRNSLEMRANVLLKTSVTIGSEIEPKNAQRDDHHDQPGKQFL